MKEQMIGLIESENWRAAESLAREQLREEGNPQAYCILVKFLEERGLPERALAGLRELVTVFPENISFLLEYARLLTVNGFLVQAIDTWLQVVELAPELETALYNLAKAFLEIGEPEKSIAIYEKLLRLSPDYESASYNLANLHQRRGDFIRAVALYKDILIREPLSVNSWVNIGMAYKSLKEYAKSEYCYRRVLAIEPENVTAHWNLANLLLALARWSEGWPEFEWRLRRSESFFPPQIRDIPAWSGGDLAGKSILLWVEQGAGDAIQFVRFVKLLPGPPKRVAVYCPPHLVRLLGAASGVELVVSYSQPPPPADCQLSLLSLPERLRLYSSEQLSVANYIQPQNVDVEISDVEFESEFSSGKIKAGLVWAGNPHHRNDCNRSLKAADFAEILEVENVAFFSLQVSNGGQKTESGGGWGGVGDRLIDLAPYLGDFQDTAGWLVKLDLLITVDTAVAHLAGALGVPAWVLLPYDPDWRWSVTGSNSLWYSSLRLFRQQQAGAWQPVLAQVKQELLKL